MQSNKSPHIQQKLTNIHKSLHSYHWQSGASLLYHTCNRSIDWICQSTYSS